MGKYQMLLLRKEKKKKNVCLANSKRILKKNPIGEQAAALFIMLQL